MTPPSFALKASIGALAFALITTPAHARKARATSHEVVAGETLGGLAARYGCGVDELQAANGLEGDLIRVGQTLTIPACDGPRRAEGSAASVEHVVLPGETLSAIAERYGVSVAQVKAWNRGARGIAKDIIRPGQKLKVIPTLPVRPRRKFVYRIEAGDTCERIAKRNGMSLKEMEQLNPKKTRKGCRYLRIGDTLNLYREGPEKASVAKGRAYDGRLVDGEQLPAGPGYFRRRPQHAWGTNETISALLEAIADVRRAHKKVHDVAIGDLSARSGGRLPPHKSHQSGRDVDLGFWFEGQPGAGPKAFISALKHPLDMEANWTFMRSLVGDSPRTSRVEYIFLDYRLQKRFYEWARKHKKATKRELEWMFQYPRGRRALQGMIRHEPGHHDHYHIRFRCARGDNDCA